MDEYLSTINPSQRQALQRIRNTVHELVPEAEEMISYGIPTFKYRGKPLIHFAAFKDHMSVFPTADPMIQVIGDQLAEFRTSKGTLQFTEDNPIPEDLIRKIVETRLKSISNS